MITAEEGSDPKPTRRRSRLRPVVFISLSLLLVGLPLVWFWRQAHARYTVVGKTDPVTGYRAVYTVSQGWKKTTSTLLSMPATDKELVEHSQFDPPPPNSIQIWINTHIFHRTPPSKTQSNIFLFGPAIRIYILRADTKKQGLVEDSEGYLSIKSWPPQVHIIRQERLQISGQPATWLVLRMQISPSQQLYDSILLLKPLHQPIWFEMSGMADNEVQFKDILQEATAIRDSLCIEKSPVQGRK